MRQEMTKEAAEDILGLPQRYGKDDVRKAYMALARQYHPDAAAQQGIDPAVAQERMVEANKANEVLRHEFDDASDRVVTRSFGGIEDGFPGVDWRAGAADDRWSGDPWEFAEDWSSEPPPEKVPLNLRTVLLGPVVLRAVFVAGLAWLWWHTFPLLSHNMDRYLPDGPWTVLDAARLVAAMVYPSYLLLYEAASGYISGLVREVLNGLVSLISGHYIDLRPKSFSYGCALYKLLREEVYALLLGPLALYAAGFALATDQVVPRVLWGLLALFLLIDTLAACAHGGLINVWTSALSERVEAWYLLLRARVLKRCNVWRGRH